MTDPLTALPQRPALQVWLTDALRAAVASGHEVAVGLIDIDAFGAVIETLGMAAADLVMQTLASRLQVAVDHAGGRLARAAGDEFAVVLPAVEGPAEARRLLGAVVEDAFAPPLGVSGQTLYLTASTGIALSPPSEPQELLRRATVEQARIKAAGGGRTAIYQPLPSATAGTLALHTDLHAALERGQVIAHYQPIVDVVESRVVGVEALVRWVHPDRGVLAPVEFLPGVTDTPLIESLGASVLRQACADAALLVTQVSDLSYFSVNVAPRQLADRQFVERVLRELQAAGLSPHRLLLEITEVARVEELTNARAVMDELRGHGVRITIDDFGTGYATLAALRELPIDMLKIDRTFIAGLGHSDDDATIIASIASLARSMGIETVADAVETDEQADAVRALGCRYAQGHRWSPAVAPADLPDAIERINRVGHRRARRPRGLPGGPVETRRILEMHRSGASVQTIAAALNRAGLQTVAGTRWHAAQVQRVLETDAAEDRGSG